MTNIIMIDGIQFFWMNIEKKVAVMAHKKDIKDFDKHISIISLDDKRSLIYIDKKIYFYNGTFVVDPKEETILKYDKYFSELIMMSYKAIKDIFYVKDLQTKEENKSDELVIIIDKLKKGQYGDINKSKYWFLDIFPYIKSASFYCRDQSMPEENKTYTPNYGGRCLELLSDKKIIIDNVPIEQATIHFEMERLKTTILREIMEANGIPPNPCIPYKEKIKEKDPSQKDILDSWD